MNPDQLPRPDGAPDPDDIFLIKPSETTRPADKKSLVLVTSLAVVGVMVVIAASIFALISSASQPADDYRRLEVVQINKIDSALEDLEPSTVINQRNLDKTLAQIADSDATQPALKSVLASFLNPRYQQTEKVQTSARQHYSNIKAYGQQLKQLLGFDSSLQTVADQEPNLIASINPHDSLSIRSISGSYSNFAKEIKDTPAPPQIKKIKDSLVKLSQDKAGAYLAWAVAIENNNPTGEAAAQQTIQTFSGKAGFLSDDQNYIESMTPSYQNLLKQHRALKQLLA